MALPKKRVVEILGKLSGNIPADKPIEDLLWDAIEVVSNFSFTSPDYIRNQGNINLQIQAAKEQLSLILKRFKEESGDLQLIVKTVNAPQKQTTPPTIFSFQLLNEVGEKFGSAVFGMQGGTKIFPNLPADEKFAIEQTNIPADWKTNQTYTTTIIEKSRTKTIVVTNTYFGANIQSAPNNQNQPQPKVTAKLTEQLGKKTVKLTQQLGTKTQKVTQLLGSAGQVTESLGTQQFSPSTNKTQRLPVTGQTTRVQDGPTQQIGVTGPTVPVIATGTGIAIGKTRKLKTKTIYQGSALEAQKAGATRILTQKIGSQATAILSATSRQKPRQARPTVRLTTQLPPEEKIPTGGQVFVAPSPTRPHVQSAPYIGFQGQTEEDIVRGALRSNPTNETLDKIRAGDLGQNISYYEIQHGGSLQRGLNDHFSESYWRDFAIANPDAAQEMASKRPHMPALQHGVKFQNALQNNLSQFGAIDPSLEQSAEFREAKLDFSRNISKQIFDTEIASDTPFSTPQSPQGVADMYTKGYETFLRNFQEKAPPQLQGFIQRILPGAEKASQAAATSAKTAGTAVGTAAKTAAAEGLKAGAKTAASATAKGVASTAAKGAITGALAGAEAATGPIGWALLALQVFGGKIIEFLKNPISSLKILLRKSAKVLATLGAGLMLAGLGLGNIFLGGAGALAFGLSLAGGGPAIMFATAMSATLAFFSALAGILMPLLTKLVLYTIGGIIAFVALTMFIINSGGYVTPASISLNEEIIAEETSDFFTVTKTANAANLNPSDLPRTVTFTITIIPSGRMTNITFQNTYTVTQNPKIAPVPQPKSCREAQDAPGGNCYPSIPTTLNPGQNYTFYYDIDLNPSYADAMVCDTFSVTADNNDGDSGTANASYCVTVGDPDLPPGTCGIAGGGDISQQLTQRVPGSVVNLLPETMTARSTQRQCITPTMIVMHWNGQPSSFEGSPTGNNLTYNTLRSRGLPCQLATDTNDLWIMQPFFERQVEMAWCSTFYNANAIANEMSGNNFRSSQLNTNIMPNANELDMAYDMTEELMRQYNIPWCQIYGHFEIPGQDARCNRPRGRLASGALAEYKYDPGDIFLYDTFIPEMARRAPNNSCGSVQTVIAARRSC